MLRAIPLLLVLLSFSAPAQGAETAAARLRGEATTASGVLRLYLNPNRTVWELNLRRVRGMTVAALVCEDGRTLIELADLSAYPVNVEGLLNGSFGRLESVCGEATLGAAIRRGKVGAVVGQAGRAALEGTLWAK